jgi:hypothetical protein
MDDDPNLNQGVGGGPRPPLGGPSLAEEEKALKKGSTGVLVGGVVAALVVAGGLGFVLLQTGGDDREAYSAIGRQVNGMKQEHFDGFWGCALPGHPLDRLGSDRDLRRAIHERARRAPARYAGHVRSECMVELTEHEPGLRQLIAPDDLSGQLEELTGALVSLRESWDDYIAALERGDHAEGYDEAAYQQQITRIAKGWHDYKHAYSETNDTIRGHLTE